MTHPAIDSTVLLDVVHSRDLGDSAHATLATLPPSQRARHDRLRRAVDRADYVAARAVARALVQKGTGVGSDRLVLRQQCPGCHRNDHGRPAVVIDGRAVADVSVSWSHSTGTVAAAVGLGSDVGIDVERTTSADPHHELLDIAVDREERASLASAPDRGRAFCDVWVRKEALVKLGVISLDQALRRSVEGILSEHPDTTVTSWEVPAREARVGLAVKRATRPPSR